VANKLSDGPGPGAGATRSTADPRARKALGPQPGVVKKMARRRWVGVWHGAAPGAGLLHRSALPTGPGRKTPNMAGDAG